MGRAALLTATILALATTLVAGCAPDPGAPRREDETIVHPDAPPIAPFETCDVITAREPALSAAHVTPGTSIDYPFHPPASGTHYSQWADFRAYDAPVPWGYLVHSMEHGAVVLAYRCEGATCADVLAAFDEVIAAHGPDPACRTAELGARFVLVPDPELEQPIAIVAWEHVYLATCIDVPSMIAFVEAHYAQAPEDFCSPGIDPPG